MCVKTNPTKVKEDELKGGSRRVAFHFLQTGVSLLTLQELGTGISERRNCHFQFLSVESGVRHFWGLRLLGKGHACVVSLCVGYVFVWIDGGERRALDSSVTKSTAEKEEINKMALAAWPFIFCKRRSCR